MEAGNVNQFLENITWQEEAVLYDGQKYFFNPCSYHDHANLEIQQWNLRNEWVCDFYEITAASIDECIKKMTAAPIWNGKTFWEAESEMTWTEW